MKSTSSAYRSHLAGSSTSEATIIKATRKDGFVLAITDHDRDIVFSGTTYLAKLAVDASDVEVSAALNVDNLEMKGFVDALGVSEADVAAGLWDFAAVQISRVNWRDLSMGDDKIKSGWIGEVSLGRSSFTSEVRGLTQKLQQVIGESYSPSCKTDLFSSRCKVLPTEGVWKFSGVITSTVVDPFRQFTAAALGQAADFFTAGLVTWTGGDNAGLSKEIKLHAAGGVIVLQEPIGNPIQPGDVFTIFAGCQKRWEMDCKGKFANGKNHQGFPFLPGEDATLRGI